MNFAVCDIEASKWINFLCIGYYDGKNYIHFLNLNDFFEHCFKQQEEVKNIFAHFGGIYDFMFLFKHLFSKLNEYEIYDIIPRGSSILCFKVKQKINGKILNFRDSSALLSFSLRSLAENFEVETKKGDIDYDKIEKVTPELLDYMKDDHLALYQCLEKFSQWDSIDAVGMKFTIASQAMEIFKKLHCPRKLIPLSKINDEFCRKSFMGGRTEIFKPLYIGNENKKLFYYDINSMYPKVLRDNDFPDRIDFYCTEYLADRLGIYHCKVKSPKNLKLPILGTKIEGKFIFPEGEFSGHWCTPELNFAIERGYRITEVYHGAIFKNAGRIFESFVDYFYNKRLQAKIEKKPVDDILSKLILNSCYGKFGLNDEKYKLAISENGEGSVHCEIQTDNGKIRLVKEKSEMHSYSNVAIASFVTAYGRCLLYEKFESVNFDVYYCDTDSLFTSTKINTSSKLGDLKLENSFDRACFLLPKTYLVENDNLKSVTMKGFDKKKIQNFKIEDFIDCLEGEMRLKNKSDKKLTDKKDIDSINLNELNNKLVVKNEAKFNKFATAKNNKNFLSMSKSHLKRVSSNYDKRIIYKENGEYLTRSIMV